MPGDAWTPSKLPSTVTWVFCDQYWRGRKITVLSSCQYQAPTTGFEVRSWIARSTAALLLIARLNIMVIGIPTPYCRVGTISDRTDASVPSVVISALKSRCGVSVWNVLEAVTFLWFVPMAVAVTV